MDLIFRSMSHAAGAEIPAGKHLPWEKTERSSFERLMVLRRKRTRLGRSIRLILAATLGFIGSRLTRAGAALEADRFALNR